MGCTGTWNDVVILDLPFHVVSVSVLLLSLGFAAQRQVGSLRGLALGVALSGFAAFLMGQNVLH